MRQRGGGSPQVTFVSDYEWQQQAHRIDNCGQPVMAVDQPDSKAPSVWQMTVSRCLSILAVPAHRKKA